MKRSQLKNLIQEVINESNDPSWIALDKFMKTLKPKLAKGQIGQDKELLSFVCSVASQCFEEGFSAGVNYASSPSASKNGW